MVMAETVKAKRKISSGGVTRTTTVRESKTTKAPKPKVGVLRSDCFRVLNDDNEADPKLEPRLSKEQLLRMYRNMALTRAYDERGMMLQRQGRIGFTVPSFGQEAIQTGTVAAIEDEDFIFPSYREPGVFIYRGASLYQMVSNLYGNSGDVCKGRQMPVHYSFADLKLFSVSSPIATQVIQAVGAAMAYKIRKEKNLTITYFGDGGTSENDFHTGMTFAGAFKAPTIFICTNNQYAISVPVFKQMGNPKIVDKAAGYGMPGIAVDGNDVLAVYAATKAAADRARRGEGPSFLECLTLRMGPHSSSDDPTRYRDEKLFEAWQKRDPIKRFCEYLTRKKLWNADLEKKLQEEIKSELATAVEKAEGDPQPSLEEFFDDVYAKLTPQLERQKRELLHERELRGKFENTSEAFPL